MSKTKRNILIALPILLIMLVLSISIDGKKTSGDTTISISQINALLGNTTASILPDNTPDPALMNWHDGQWERVPKMGSHKNFIGKQSVKNTGFALSLYETENWVYVNGFTDSNYTITQAGNYTLSMMREGTRYSAFTIIDEPILYVNGGLDNNGFYSMGYSTQEKIINISGIHTLNPYIDDYSNFELLYYNEPQGQYESIPADGLLFKELLRLQIKAKSTLNVNYVKNFVLTSDDVRINATGTYDDKNTSLDSYEVLVGSQTITFNNRNALLCERGVTGYRKISSGTILSTGEYFLMLSHVVNQYPRISFPNYPVNWLPPVLDWTTQPPIIPPPIIPPPIFPPIFFSGFVNASSTSEASLNDIAYGIMLKIIDVPTLNIKDNPSGYYVGGELWINSVDPILLLPPLFGDPNYLASIANSDNFFIKEINCILDNSMLVSAIYKISMKENKSEWEKTVTLKNFSPSYKLTLNNDNKKRTTTIEPSKPITMYGSQRILQHANYEYTIHFNGSPIQLHNNTMENLGIYTVYVDSPTNDNWVFSIIIEDSVYEPAVGFKILETGTFYAVSDHTNLVEVVVDNYYEIHLQFTSSEYLWQRSYDDITWNAVTEPYFYGKVEKIFFRVNLSGIEKKFIITLTFNCNLTLKNDTNPNLQQVLQYNSFISNSLTKVMGSQRLNYDSRFTCKVWDIDTNNEVANHNNKLTQSGNYSVNLFYGDVRIADYYVKILDEAFVKINGISYSVMSNQDIFISANSAYLIAQATNTTDFILEAGTWNAAMNDYEWSAPKVAYTNRNEFFNLRFRLRSKDLVDQNYNYVIECEKTFIIRSDANFFYFIDAVTGVTTEISKNEPISDLTFSNPQHISFDTNKYILAELQSGGAPVASNQLLSADLYIMMLFELTADGSEMITIFNLLVI